MAFGHKNTLVAMLAGWKNNYFYVKIQAWAAIGMHNKELCEESIQNSMQKMKQIGIYF